MNATTMSEFVRKSDFEWRLLRRDDPEPVTGSLIVSGQSGSVMRVRRADGAWVPILWLSDSKPMVSYWRAVHPWRAGRPLCHCTRCYDPPVGTVESWLAWDAHEASR